MYVCQRYALLCKIIKFGCATNYVAARQFLNCSRTSSLILVVNVKKSKANGCTHDQVHICKVKLLMQSGFHPHFFSGAETVSLLFRRPGGMARIH